MCKHLDRISVALSAAVLLGAATVTSEPAKGHPIIPQLSEQ